jgi:hypothetical protein
MRAAASPGIALWLQSTSCGRITDFGSQADMNALRQSSRAALLCLACAFVSPVSGATPTVPDERDRQVLETLLLHLLADTKFDMTWVSTNRATIVLHTRTPEGTGFLMSHQIRSDIGGHSLPDDAEQDLRNRNSPRDARPNTYDAVSASFTNLTFSSGIVVADLTDKWGGRHSGSFKEAHPKARGWVEAYLPGYSKDGTRAVVRAGVGPSAHGAMVTSLVEKRDAKWAVKWHHIAWYA